MSKNKNNKKELFTRVVALYNQLLTTIPLPPVSLFKAQSISPADRGVYKLQALVYDILPSEEGDGKRCSECGAYTVNTLSFCFCLMSSDAKRTRFEGWSL